MLTIHEPRSAANRPGITRRSFLRVGALTLSGLTLGDVLRLRGAGSGIPPYVSLGNKIDWEQAYYVGLEHEPFRVGGGNSREPLDNLSRCRDVSAQRLENRKDLLHAFDTLRRDLDSKGTLKGIDACP